MHDTYQAHVTSHRCVSECVSVSVCISFCEISVRRCANASRWPLIVARGSVNALRRPGVTPHRRTAFKKPRVLTGGLRKAFAHPRTIFPQTHRDADTQTRDVSLYIVFFRLFSLVLRVIVLLCVSLCLSVSLLLCVRVSVGRCVSVSVKLACAGAQMLCAGL